MRRPAWILALLLLMIPRPGAAQTTLSSTANASCLGDEFGCSQTDFFFWLTGAGGAADLDYLSITLLTAGWRFSDPNFAEAEDARGDFVFVNPLIDDGGTLFNGEFLFGPARVTSDPQSLRVRAEFVGSPTGPLEFAYEGGNSAGDILIAGRGTTATVTPEPASLLLLGTGLAGIAGTRRQRNRKKVTPTEDL